VNLANFIRGFVVLSLAGLLSSCAFLHHYQLGDIDSRNEKQVWIPFDIKMSEVGVSAEEIGGIARAAQTRGGDDVSNVAAVVSLFQMGPRTGNPVYDARYAEKLIYEIYQKCPSGRITGLTSIREMRKYPVISGEIVKVTGFCAKDRVARKSTSDDPQITEDDAVPGDI
jgi:hypothetical protein